MAINTFERVKKYRQNPKHKRICIRISSEDKEAFKNLEGLGDLINANKLRTLMNFWNDNYQESETQWLNKELISMKIVRKKLNTMNVNKKLKKFSNKSKILVNIKAKSKIEQQNTPVSIPDEKNQEISNTNKNSKSEAFHNVWGYLNASKNRYDEALMEYEETLKINPKNANAYYNIACINALKNNKKQALINLKKSILIDKSYKKIALKDKDFDLIKNEKEFLSLLK